MSELENGIQDELEIAIVFAVDEIMAGARIVDPAKRFRMISMALFSVYRNALLSSHDIAYERVDLRRMI